MTTRIMSFIFFVWFATDIAGQSLTDLVHIMDYSSSGAGAITADENFYYLAFGDADSVFIGGESYLDVNNQSVILKRQENTIWSKIIHSGYANQVTEMKIDVEGNLIAVGYSYWVSDITIDDLTGYGQTFIAKIDPDGNALWLKVYSNFYATAVDVDCSNHIIIGGHFAGTIDFAGEQFTSESMWPDFPYNVAVLGLDSEGEEIWGRAIPGNFMDTTFDLITDSNCDIYLSGSMNAGNMILQNDTLLSGAFLIKMNSSGEDLWSKNISGFLDEGITSSVIGKNLCINSNGEVYWLFHMKGDSITTELGTIEVSDCAMFVSPRVHILLRLNSAGTLLSQQGFQCSDSFTEYWDLQSIGDQIAVAGDYNTEISIPSGQILETPDNVVNTFFMLTNPDLIDVWHINSQNTDIFSWVKTRQIVKWGDKIILKGTFLSEFNMGNFELESVDQGDLFLAFFDLNTMVPHLNSPDNELVIYPNPVTDLMNLRIPQDIPFTSLDIYDSMGRRVHSQTSAASIWVGDFPNGFYHVLIRTENSMITTSFIKCD